jgi:uracil-DNA glycosylase
LKSLAIRPTLLFSRNEDVDTVNVKNVAALNQPLYTYDVKTVIIPDPANPVEVPRGEELDWVVRKLDADANYMPHLELCVGCQVMLLKNQDVELGLVNGSRGVVVGFTGQRDPIVQFLRGDPIIIGPHNWQSNECPAVHRSQLPLRVAYAITIHKSQGVTLDCALVDIGSSTFEFGQAYVALSRVRDLESLYVWNLDASKIRAHPAVVRFYERLPTAVLVDPEPVPSQPVSSQSSLIPRDLDAAWMRVLDGWADTPIGRDCMARVVERQAVTQVYPATEDIFAALRHGSPSDVRVVLLGQDPYHGPGQAHGLSFSVQHGVALPPSLRNIRKEYLTDCGGNDTSWVPSVGTLTPWARQGVLLLNSVLTVEAGNPNSHAGIGWEDLTQKLLAAVVEARANQPLVFVAWGRHAQTIVHKLRLDTSHTIIESAHPSPLSAHHGFFGSKPFTRVNAYLTAAGQTPIQWALPAPSQM